MASVIGQEGLGDLLGQGLSQGMNRGFESGIEGMRKQRELADLMQLLGQTGGNLTPVGLAALSTKNPNAASVLAPFVKQQQEQRTELKETAEKSTQMLDILSQMKDTIRQHKGSIGPIAGRTTGRFSPEVGQLEAQKLALFDFYQNLFDKGVISQVKFNKILEALPGPTDRPATALKKIDFFEKEMKRDLAKAKKMGIDFEGASEEAPESSDREAAAMEAFKQSGGDKKKYLQILKKKGLQ